jgi:hypothetical protein
MVENIANLRKWEFIKAWRTKYEDFVRARERKRRLILRWVKQVKGFKVLNSIAEEYQT